jgi:hypothetical protein
MHGPKLKKVHKDKVRAYVLSPSVENGIDMMTSLEGRLTESYLDAFLAAGVSGVDALLAAIPEDKEVVKEEVLEETPYEPAAVEAPALTEAEVEAAVEEAEVTATEEEKTIGFWRRIGNFFKGLFVR